MPTPAPLRKLLVPLDGSPRSEEALPYALAVAGGDTEATIVTLHVVPDAQPLRKPLGQITKTADEVMAELTADAQAELQAAVDRSGAAETGVRVETLVRVGNVADTILDVADELAVDAVVLAGSGRGNISRLVVGSVADRVARESTRPTLVVREHETAAVGSAPTIRRLVVPLDGSERAQAALPLAASLAAHLSIPIALITVVEPQTQMGAVSVGGAAFSAEMYQGLDEEVEAVSREQLTEAEKSLAASGVPVTTELAHGSAAGAVMAFASSADLVVMTSRGHGGIVRMVLGSVADTIVREGPSPVLLVPSTE